jgi:hypothetical protein
MTNCATTQDLLVNGPPVPSNDTPPDEAPETPPTEPQPEPIKDPPAEPQPPYVVT